MSRYTINWTDELKAKAIERLTEYLSKYGYGESIMQDDNAQIEAPELLSDIADFDELVGYTPDLV